MSNGIIATLPELIALQGVTKTHGRKMPVRSTQHGSHTTAHRGRGIDFSEVRNYQAGDEIRHMEWRMTARTGRPHVKLYEETRERPVLILVDFSTTMYFGTKLAFKSFVAAQLASILAWTAVKQGDKVGGLVFSETQHQLFTPKLRESSILPMLACLSDYTKIPPRAKQNDTKDELCDALLRINRVIKPGSLLILISDFYTLTDTAKQHLHRLITQNEMLAFHIADPVELTPPPPGIYPITDGTQTAWLDTRSKTLRQTYQNNCHMHVDTLKNQFRQLKTPFQTVTATTNLKELVLAAFPRRAYG